MQFGSELDMQEIEYQLYNQVYHSYVDWEKDSPSAPNEQLNATDRRVTRFSVTNISQTKNRYWREDQQRTSVTSTQPQPAVTEPADVSVIKKAPETKQARKDKYKRKERRRSKRKTNKTAQKRKENSQNENDAMGPTPPAQDVPYNNASPAQVTESQEPPAEEKPVLSKSDVRCVDVVVLSDSDSDSVEEIPLPPIPTYTVDSSEDEETPEAKREAQAGQQLKMELHTESSNQESRLNTPELRNDMSGTDNLAGEGCSVTNVLLQSDKEILSELAERAELLNTPDSAANDFIHRDVAELNKDNPRFGFNLLAYDLENMGHDFLRPARKAAAMDAYETESSCSEMGNQHEPNVVFPEVNFETNAKEIFSEPDLRSFSDFITPNRAERKTAEESTKDKVESETNEYDSDPTVLSAKKKRKRKNCKSRKRSGKKACETEASGKINDVENETEETERVPGTTENRDESEMKAPEVTGETIDVSNNKPELATARYCETENSNNEDVFIDVCGNNSENLQIDIGTDQKFSFLQAWEDMKQDKLLENSGTNMNADENSADSDKEIDVGVEINIDSNVIVLSDDSYSNPVPNIEKLKVEAANEPLDDRVPAVQEELILNTTGEREKAPSSPECSTSKGRKSKSPKKKLVKNPFNVCKSKSFSDFWTTDMKKFYDDSWGQENYDLERELANMSSDPSKWKIIPEDIYKTPLRKSGPRCLRCKQFGHTRYECPKLSRQKCSACGSAGHFHARCPQLMCTTCGRKGGYHTTSCANCSNYGSIKCSLCRMRGHADRNCPDLWRRYHVTTKENSSPRSSKLKLKPIESRWCCGCAKKGHFQHECRQPTSEHFRTLPNVVSYSPTYNAILHFSQLEPEPVPAAYQRSRISDLRTSLITKNTARYKGMLRSLKIKCRKYDSTLVEHVESLQRDLRNNRFDCKKVKMLYKLNNRLKKCM